MWKTIAVVLCLGSLCFACGEKEAPKGAKSKSEASQKESEEKVTAEGSDQVTAEGSDPTTVAPASKPGDDFAKKSLELTPADNEGGCAARCVHEKMAVAMGAEAIEAECVNECNECIAECVKRRSVEAVGADVIDRECAADCPEEKP